MTTPSWWRENVVVYYYLCLFGNAHLSHTWQHGPGMLISQLSTLGGTVGPRYGLGRWDFIFLSCPLYFFPYSLLSSYFFICFFVLFNSCCSDARLFGKTIVHEVPISYSQTERYFLFLSLVQDKLNIPRGPYHRHCS